MAVPCAYALAKLRFAARRAAVRPGAARPADPAACAGDPALHLLSQAGLLEHLCGDGAALDHLGVRHLLIRQFFRTVPDDLIHAARLDGLSEFAIVWRIMLPTAVPAHGRLRHPLGGLALERLLLALLIVTSARHGDPALGQVLLRNAEAGTDYGALMAGDCDHHRAADDRLSVRAAPIHRGHDPHRPERLNEGGASMKSRTSACRRRRRGSAGAPAGCARSGATEIRVQYSIPDLFKDPARADRPEFMAANPQYKVTFRRRSRLRGGRRRRPARGRHQHPAGRRLPGPQPAARFYERNIPGRLEAFIDADPDFKSYGHCTGPARRSARFGGKQTRHRLLALDADHLLQRRPGDQGGRRPGQTAGRLGRVFAARAARSRPGGTTQGMFFDWTITGNWMWQALVFANGGTMLTADETKVAFDGAGRQDRHAAAAAAWSTEGKMPDISPDYMSRTSAGHAWASRPFDGAARRLHQRGRRPVPAV